MSNSASNFEKFAYDVTPFQQSGVNKLARHRERQYLKTGEEVETIHGDPSGNVDQLVPVYTTEYPYSIDNTVVVRLGGPWSDDFGRPENRHWDAYWAKNLRRTVVSINTPGIDSSRWGDADKAGNIGLSPNQIQGLKNGRYENIGAAMVRALIEARESAHFSGTIPETEKYVFYNTSMGHAITGAGLRAALNERLRVVGAALGEGVNFSPNNPVLFASRFVRANSTAKKYLAQNPGPLRQATESDATWLSRVMEAKSTNYKLFRALARGGFYQDIGELGDYDDILFHISRGSRSKLSPAEDFDSFVQKLDVHGVPNDEEVYEDDNHGYTMTLGFAIHAVKRALGEESTLAA